MKGTALRGEADSISVAVVEAIATATDTDPLELDSPLYDVIDTDALDRLVRQDSLTRVEFEYEGHAVEIDGDGVIAVDGATVAPEEVGN